MEEKRDRDAEAITRRCQPYQVGSTLIFLMMFAVTLQLAFRPGGMQFGGLVSLYVSSLLTTYMLFSLCARNSYTAAWVTVVFSPLVIAMFALQVGPLFG